MMDVKIERPLLPLRDIVVFPNMVVPLFVGRDKSIAALNEVMKKDKKIVLVTQKNSEIDDPKKTDVFMYGCEGNILQLLKLPDGTVKVLVEGSKRVKILDFKDNEKFIICEYAHHHDVVTKDEDLIPLAMTAVRRLEKLTSINKKVSSETINNIKKLTNASHIADNIASHLTATISEKQQIFETIDVKKRLNSIIKIMENETSIIGVEKRIRGRVKTQMEKTQREYYLNEQLKAIQKELGEIEDGKDETSSLNKLIIKAKMPKDVEKKCMAELKKLKNMSPMSAEATVIRNYLDWMTDLPWYKKSQVDIDLKKALAVLDADHFGLEKVKERIIEFLAVQKRMEKIKGPILCLVGPPGVGKTSLGKSIAKATNREFVRVSVGGMRDEAEIRGHRRTYIGSLPGKIIQMMKKAGTKNPLILLDEIDKIGNDYRGDPSSALLEALDPEQNTTFNDHYLEVDYDLSDVMFVTTANTLNILPPLLDRMEVIRLAGYTEDEKINIANKYLLPKQVKDNGVKENEMTLSEDIIKEIIQSYTKESGVRNLEREISKVARKVVKKVVSGEEKEVKIDLKNLPDYLGIQKFKFGELESKDKIGVVTGLAWTEYGGEILKIETVIMPGKGRMQITGKLGEVMQESIKAAKSFIRSKSLDYGIIPPLFEKKDFHIHVPEGATPKDGPSAGIGMVTSIVSAITNNPVRRDVAMTGEVTLTGQVLPIGGLKEKLLAAHRAGIKQVIIPKENEKDLVDMPKKIIDDIKITPVEHADEVLKIALTKELKRVEWVEVEKISQSNDKSQASIQ
ncbi:endopeptidase La [Candidatus Pelagibacter ubique]|jgi:ATP-dependent Lon protease|uniref:endopeptidase La n=1 Tax=Pelagibacter ubique TaxID=198252 RepID=UPI000481499C|nr:MULTISPECIES: endopeptidase La [Pelagibacter]MDA7447385.1 endopeptidase La [Candidatus Pelagibacter ubique]MDA7456433.1 endopeptidase La [Candidatus Pelagibacter ubique]MDA7458022.1 endopeptidase La [Candidatus Pelagibacter ubique]MDA7460187.1 endopeptidase La [Candidatus Pelagibacter ubique]MDA7465392.1 endopeptidase La [Candidatus Pelagibacter ubique]